LEHVTTIIARAPFSNTPPWLDCVVSPDGIYVATILVDKEDASKSRLILTSIDQQTSVAEVSAMAANDLVLLPEDVRWAPSNNGLFVFMKYSDMPYGGGGEWLEFDLPKSEFAPDAKERVGYLLSLTKDGRPDYFSSPQRNFPVWDRSHKNYPSEHAAFAAGVERLWESPSFFGSARAATVIKGRWYEVLIEQGIGQSVRAAPPHALPTARAYVVSNGVLIHEMEVASSHTPDRAVLFYQDEDLMLFGGADDEKNGYRPWKVRFPQSRLTRLLVVNGDPQTGILATQSRSASTVYLVRMWEKLP
jgi:hypothetical protein